MKNEEKILEKLSTFESQLHKFENHQRKMTISIIDLKDALVSVKGEVGWIKDNMVIKADQDKMMVILNRLDADRYASIGRFERIESDIETTNEQVAEHHQILTKANLI